MLRTRRRASENQGSRMKRLIGTAVSKYLSVRFGFMSALTNTSASQDKHPP